MGLDMYLIGQKSFYSRNEPLLEDGYPVRSRELELGYWRKHPNLHGYIVEMFADGKDECQEISLTAENLEQIISAVEHDRLIPTEGFFFDFSDGSEKPHLERDLYHALTTLLGAERSARIMPRSKGYGQDLARAERIAEKAICAYGDKFTAEKEVPA